MTRTNRRTYRAFSLLELVIVVVIIGIISAIAIPRLSRGSAGAADASLSGDLAVLRNAIDVYSAEHSSKLPTAAAIENQLLQYTNAAGEAQAAQDSTHIYGPYLRKIPPLPVGARKGCTTIAKVDADGVGWIYDEDTGAISANTADSEKDASGTAYNAY